jgi:hypothetical protein
MVGDAGARSVEPVVNPGLGDARRRRLIRMTKEQIAGRAGPLRQVRQRDRVVSPLALGSMNGKSPSRCARSPNGC